jgi:hypothetical protein
MAEEEDVALDRRTQARLIWGRPEEGKENK